MTKNPQKSEPGLQNALVEEQRRHHGHHQRAHHKERRPSMCQNLAKRSAVEGMGGGYNSLVIQESC